MCWAVSAGVNKTSYPDIRWIFFRQDVFFYSSKAERWTEFFGAQGEKWFFRPKG